MIEYIYENVKKDSRVKLLKASADLGFDENVVDKTLLVESNGIQVFLYQVIGDNDFILSVNYKDNNITHWHINQPSIAIENLNIILEGKLWVVIEKPLSNKKINILTPIFADYEKELKKVINNKKYLTINF